MYVNPLNGESYRSVTNCLSIIDKPALKNWAAKQTAEFAWDHRDTWIDLPKRAAVDLMKREALRYTGAAAEVGTAVHELAEKYITGEEVDVDVPVDGLDGDVTQFKQFLEDFAPEYLMVESTVYNDEVKYAGTLDAVVNLPGHGTVVLDIKTGGVWPEAALQLSAYANADYAVTGPPYKQVEMPHIDGAVILQLKPRSYKLIELDSLSTDTFRAFRAAAFLAGFKSERFDFLVGDPLQPRSLRVA
jgi:hypothetical protein